jgi:protein-S-isoprenylcysteine O-methyltransferase Ste14
MSDTTGLALLAAAWIGYAAIHSALASLTVKRRVAARWPAAMPAYRLAYNAVAVATLAPIAWLVRAHPGPTLWQWRGIGWWLANGLALAAVLGFLLSLRYYDSGEFSGMRQWRLGIRAVADQERFHLSPLHRWVRHPWYFLGLVIVWTRDMSAAMFVSALFITAYFTIGSRLEERKLLVYHGERYRRYRQRVAGLIPLPWKILSRAEAEELLAGPDHR